MDLGNDLPKFDTWQDLIAHVTAGRRVLYYAPCILPIERINVRAVAGKHVLRIVPIDRDYDPFTADEGHLDRFRNAERS